MLAALEDVSDDITFGSTKRAHPELNQGPADLQSAALTTELYTRGGRQALKPKDATRFSFKKLSKRSCRDLNSDCQIQSLE